MSKEAVKPEHEILACKIELDGRIIFTVQFDTEQRDVNFHLNKYCKAQIMGDEDWFSRNNDNNAWFKMTPGGGVVARYGKDQNRIARLLERMIQKAILELILGEV